MKKYKWFVILINLIILLVIFNNSVFKKEALLANGQLVLLELAPVDPRSLMQGDYMILSYGISADLVSDSIPKRGFCVVELPESGIGNFVRLQEGKLPLKENEVLIEYTAGKWSQINIGAESFFFQEGDADKYENAKYGGVKVDGEGNSLLIGLYDKDLKRIE